MRNVYKLYSKNRKRETSVAWLRIETNGGSVFNMVMNILSNEKVEKFLNLLAPELFF